MNVQKISKHFSKKDTISDIHAFDEKKKFVYSNPLKTNAISFLRSARAGKYETQYCHDHRHGTHGEEQPVWEFEIEGHLKE